MNSLESLRHSSTIVADTGDIEAIKKYLPQDTTTNPSLILNTVEKNPIYLSTVISEIKNNPDHLIENLMALIGEEILKIIPGRVSIEVPAHFSFSKNETIQSAKRIIKLFNKKNISNERVLIKIAGTFPGIMAAAELEKNNIHCNITLIFSLTQALLAAQNGITLISPFVGRVGDWYQNQPKPNYSFAEDPGVELVSNIFYTLKKAKFKTQIMAASFRKEAQIYALSGCDFLTIAPKFLESLSNKNKIIKKNLAADEEENINERLDKTISQADFDWQLCQNQMASEKLYQGIRLFHKDYLTLNNLLKNKLNSLS